MGSSKHLLLLLLLAAFAAVLWRFGRAAFPGAIKWLLWCLAAVCAGAGAFVMLASEVNPVAILGGFILWAFAAYMIKVAEASRKRG